MIWRLRLRFQYFVFICLMFTSFSGDLKTFPLLCFLEQGLARKRDVSIAPSSLVFISIVQLIPLLRVVVPGPVYVVVAFLDDSVLLSNVFVFTFQSFLVKKQEQSGYKTET